MLDEVDFKLSKELSYALRHNPSAYKLTLDDCGWCSFDSLLSFFNTSMIYGKVDVGRIQAIIDDSEKKRFEIDLVNNRIRATYGHSIKDHPIVVSKPSMPPLILFHGTSRRAWESIKTEGLKPMNRQYVHLSTDRETAVRVGKRHDENPVILVVHAVSAHFGNGVKFYHSTNDQTWMSESISPEWIHELRPLTKEYVEEVENKVADLEKHEYSGHVMNTEVYNKKKEMLLLLSLASEDRIKKILDIFASFPGGLWRQEHYPNIDKYIRMMEMIRHGNNYDHLTGAISIQWYSTSSKTFGYEFVYGIDDGYPETAAIGIPSELLYADDGTLEGKIKEKVVESMQLTKLRLEKELADTVDAINNIK